MQCSHCVESVLRLTPNPGVWYVHRVFRYVVLGLLQDGEPRHGYALMKKYRDRVGVHVSTGNFYRELQRLVEGGFARNADRSLGTDPRRAPYMITEAGREAFSRWFVDVAEATTASLHEDEVSERLTFLTDVSLADVRGMLDRLQDDLWLQAKVLERSRDAAIAKGSREDTHGLPVSALIVTRRIRHLAAEVAFLGELREAYDAWVAAREPRPSIEAEEDTLPAPAATRARQRGRQ